MSDSDHKKLHLRVFGIVVFVSSVIFWAWAVLNTIHMSSGYDLGIVSFATTAVSSMYLLYRARPGLSPPGRFGQLLVLLTHLFVSFNYVLGVLYAFKWLDTVRVGFGVYCAIFVAVWLGVGIVGYWLIERERRAEGDRKDGSLAGEGGGLMDGDAGTMA